MQWKEQFGSEEAKSAVSPYDVVTAVAVNAVMQDPNVSGAQVGKANLNLFQQLYGEEVTERGLIDQVREAMPIAREYAENGAVNIVALATAHYGEAFGVANVHLISFDNQTPNSALTAQVGARIYQRRRNPFESAQAGDLVVAKKAGKAFGFTKIAEVSFVQVSEKSAEEFLAAMENAKATLATMAESIDPEQKDVVLNGEFWGQGVVSQKNENGAYISKQVPVQEAHVTMNEQGETIYNAYVTLLTYEPWVMLREVYTGTIEAENGLLWANLSIGKGPGASWYSGMNGIMQNTIGSFNATWKVPQKRGRKAKVEVEAEVENEAVEIAAA